jgi:hypothetical protein
MRIAQSHAPVIDRNAIHEDCDPQDKYLTLPYGYYSDG